MKKPLLIALSIMASFTFAQDKCLDLCASCMNNDKQDVCSKVETLCKCSDILESLSQELQATSSTSTDTVQNEVSSDTTASTDSTALQTDSLATDSITKDSIAEVPQDTIVADSIKQPELIDTTSNEQTALVPENKPKDRTFYFGISLAFEKFDEFTVADFDVHGGNRDFDNIGANLGFLLRWYMLKSISFQTGLNMVYHHGYSDIKDSELEVGWGAYHYSHDISIEYHNLMAEIPLTFRFGIPFVISPYVSLSIHVRKPLYAWIDYDFDYEWQFSEDYNYSSRSYDYDDYGSNSGAFTEDDWEFLGYLGFGLELTRHLSIQWQMLLINAVTYTTEILNYKLLTDTWRLNLDIAF